MSEDKVDETEREPGVEFDYNVNDDGDVETAVIIRDPDKVRRLVSAGMQWIPSLIAEPNSDGNPEPYPGIAELERIEREDPDRIFNMPLMVLGHMPGHKPTEEGTDDIQHQLYLLDADSVLNLIGTGINMFTGDKDKTSWIMHMLHHILSETECEGDHEDG